MMIRAARRYRFSFGASGAGAILPAFAFRISLTAEVVFFGVVWVLAIFIVLRSGGVIARLT